VLPSNEWRGYVLRKIMRRAMRHGKKLGFTEPVLHDLAGVVIAQMGGVYPELTAHRDAIVRTIRGEEERFDAVLTAGLPKLEDLIDRTIESGATTVPGDEVFKLYDSLGVPLDFTEDLAAQRGLAVDRQAFEEAMEGQRERARSGSAFGKKAGADVAFSGWSAEFEKTGDHFVGYDQTTVDRATVVDVFASDGT